MKKLIVTLTATAALCLMAAPAFACGGDKADKSDADQTTTTASTDEETCSKCDGECQCGTHATEKKAKKSKAETPSS